MKEDINYNWIIPDSEKPKPGQTRKHSFFESISNVLVGYGVAIASQIVIFPMYGIHIPIQQNLTMGLWFTLISIVRSYVLRRWFNRITVRNI